MIGRKQTMNQHTFTLISVCVATLAAAAVITLASTTASKAADDDPPLALARDGFFYVGGKTATVNGKTYVAGQMYVEMRIPAKQTHPFPIIKIGRASCRERV